MLINYKKIVEIKKMSKGFKFIKGLQDVLNVYPHDHSSSNIKYEIINFFSDIGWILSKTIQTEIDMKKYLKYIISKKESFKELRGSFNIIIYDFELQRLSIFRDFWGSRPLYYFININNEISISTRVKYLLDEVQNLTLNTSKLKEYLSFNYINQEETFFNEIKKFKPSTINLFDGKKIIARKINFLNSGQPNFDYKLNNWFEDFFQNIVSKYNTNQKKL